MKKNKKINKGKLFSMFIIIGVIIYSSLSLFQTRVKGRNKQKKEIAIFDEKVNIAQKIEKTEAEREENRDKSKIDVGASLLNQIGVLYVPKIDLQIIVYDSVKETALSRGVGLIPGTGNLPPKNNQNAVLTAHNGDISQDLFINLDNLEENDFFYIKDLRGNISKYSIEDIQIVYPDEEDDYYKHYEDQAIITLRTCTPMGINNKRLLVSGKKIPTSKTTVEIENEIKKSKGFILSKHERNMLIILIISSALFLNDFFKFLFGIIKRKKEEKNCYN